MDDEGDEVIGGEDGEGEDNADGGVEEEDFEPLPPSRRRRATKSQVERVESPRTGGGTHVEGKVASPVGRTMLSSEVSRESNSRGAGSWTPGGTQVQRRVTSSLGRRSRDNLSSDSSQDSNPPDKRLRLGSSVGEVPSLPPTTMSTPGGQSSLSQNSDAPGGTLAKPVPHRFMKQKFVPPRNRLVYILAKKLVQAEVFAFHPWPNTSTIESIVRRCWTNARRIREEERSEISLSANDQPQTREPDEIALEIVSANKPLNNCGVITFSDQMADNSVPRISRRQST